MNHWAGAARRESHQTDVPTTRCGDIYMLRESITLANTQGSNPRSGNQGKRGFRRVASPLNSTRQEYFAIGDPIATSRSSPVYDVQRVLPYPWGVL